MSARFTQGGPHRWSSSRSSAAAAPSASSTPTSPSSARRSRSILETARLASCAVNAHWLRAIVVERDKIPPEKLDQLKTPVAALTLDLAPVHIYFFVDLGIVNRIKGSRLKELVDVGALAPTHGWSHKFVDDFVYPQILEPMTQEPAGLHRRGLRGRRRRGAERPPRRLRRGARRLPEHPEPDAHQAGLRRAGRLAVAVGDAGRLPGGVVGGRRPAAAAADFEELYFEGEYGKPFKRDPQSSRS